MVLCMLRMAGHRIRQHIVNIHLWYELTMHYVIMAVILVISHVISTDKILYMNFHLSKLFV